MSQSQEVNIEKLKRKRIEIQSRLVRINKFISDFTPDQNINSLKARESTVLGALNEFNSIQDQIEDNVAVADLETETNERVKFEDLYYRTVMALATALEQYESKSKPATPNSTTINANQSSKINLPVLQIPSFSGEFGKWLSFRDVFQSLIHNNCQLDNIEKMHYLKSAVSGEARRAIENLSICGSNYEQAWSLLQERFGNERLIIQTHIRKIMNSPAITKSTAVALRQLTDDTRSNLAALKAMGRPIEQWDDILVTVIPDKLEYQSNREWQSTLQTEKPSSKTLLEFLEKRCQYLEAMAHTTDSLKQSQNKPYKSASNSVVIVKKSCALCKRNNHFLSQCKTFLQLSAAERLRRAKTLNVCQNCLRSDHDTASCNSKGTCRECQGRHHTLLHQIVTTNQTKAETPSTSTATHCNTIYSENLLLTASVLIKDKHGVFHKCRALLDSGSQSNFISKQLTENLNLKPKSINHQIVGINAQHSFITELVDITMKSNCYDYVIDMSCLVINKITGNLPLKSFSTANLGIPNNLKLADKDFDITSPIDLLIGSELFLLLLRKEQIQLPGEHLCLQNTYLGWVIGGHLNLNNSNKTVSMNNLNVRADDNLNTLVDRFWKVESLGSPYLQNYTKEELEAESQFSKTFRRDDNGRFVTKLPIKNNIVELGNSYNLAKQRFLNLETKLINILNSGGFELSKWTSNEPTCVLSSNKPKANSDLVHLDKSTETKTLGLCWNYIEDTLRYKVEPIATPTKVTKRNMLATICRIFDPLGLINPVIIKAKILFQILWIRNLDWDQSVSPDIKVLWSQLLNELHELNEIRVTRKSVLDDAKEIELHGFSDASERAYGAAIYLKSIDKFKNSHTQLLIATSHVAPLKMQSIPRLDLLAAQLSTELSNTVKKTIKIKIDRQYYWTDSTIVLAWLSKDPIHWQTFVAHRIADIQSKTNINEWRHVISADNPADIISRGAFPRQLINNSLWWHGPTWLNNPKENYSSSKNYKHETENIPEKRRVTISCLATTQEWQILSKYSDFIKLKQIIAYINRFLYNCKHSGNKQVGVLTTRELNSSNNTIMKLIQKTNFPQEYQQLYKGNEIPKGSSIQSLNPFLDKNGVIRVGGRIQNAEIPYNHKHPIILPKNHNITDAIIRHFHVINLHSGAQMTLAAIRQQYWPLAGRNKIRQLLHKCVKCFRAKPISGQQKMGNLPARRVEPARPFIHTGVDYCGPITIKTHRGRGKQKTLKAYICLFICLCTRAIHVELVSDLSTETFLNALKRFISRRGNVKCIMSDNATNFVKANKELKDLHDFFRSEQNKQELIQTLNNENIEWKFIPPRAPNFGGLWEAGIKSVKYHLKRVIGDTVLTFEEMYTLLARIEACLNSRPIIPISQDPNDLIALTPEHFLIGEASTAPLGMDLTELKTNKLSRWQLIEQLRQHFWKRWKAEYLTDLQKRSKWKTPSPPLKTGDLVLLIDDNSPPLHWPLGRIQDTHPGRDGIVRVVTVKTN